MIFRQWKPGIRWGRRSTIDGNNKVTREERNQEIEEIRETKGILDLRKDISGKGILRSERFRISLRLAIAILGLAIITATSHGHKGTIFDIVQLESRTSDREICELSTRFIQTSDRKVKVWKLVFFGSLGIFIRSIRFVGFWPQIISIVNWRFGIHGIRILREKCELVDPYIKNYTHIVSSITFKLLLFKAFIFTNFLWFYWLLIEMMQTQLVGKNGAVQSGEGMRKWLKISVPHFDNSDLIKGYSKTLIGRCINPAEQDIKALIVTFPKIWNLVDRVVGVDLDLGRFQFDSDHEEDIEAVLQM